MMITDPMRKALPGPMGHVRTLTSRGVSRFRAMENEVKRESTEENEAKRDD
jgi:hypothetical protein